VKQAAEDAAAAAAASAAAPQERPALYWVIGLVVINVLVWIAMEGAGGSEDSDTLLRFGASRAALLAEGQWWRTVTAVFIHIGLRHLLANMVALALLGWAVLQSWGVGRFYFMYLVAGVAGNWISFALSPTASIKAGASGAILGLLGVLAATRVRAIRADIRSARPSRFKTWHIIAMLVAFYGFVIGTGHVDHLAHLGGLVTGGLLAMVLPPPDTVPRQADRWLGGGLGAVSAALAGAAGLMAYL
jgi:rhomboid protease GluP